ncbi:DUF2621 domain-containing protein [Fodinisporobacter ferrooxydans]|uniref:DUF2621 domain-containing protein n=1 Tax=Fodinisporobacter ferrooxydans TaxID=2901836 RepID=A0ABY4CMQ8_9BACL|nr:DUF2621 domain-containing protein [Alicyclobacillaceae bacterium MYW30-H2]
MLTTAMFIINSILLLVLLTGGFFMFRAFLRRMRQEKGIDDPKASKQDLH